MRENQKESFKLIGQALSLISVLVVLVVVVVVMGLVITSIKARGQGWGLVRLKINEKTFLHIFSFFRFYMGLNSSISR